MAGIARYPKDFTAGGNIGTDYILLTAQRKSYAASSTASNISTPNLGGYNDGYVDDTTIGGGTYQVILYMPQKITENYSQGWTNNTLGPDVGAILSGAPLFTQKGYGGMLGRRLIEEFLMNKTLDGLGKLGAPSLTANAVLSSTGGIIYNPMLEVLYDGPDFRRLNYEFTLFSKSEDDAKEIYKIVNFFRFCSVPTYDSGTQNNANLNTVISTGGTAAGVSNILGASSLSQAAGGIAGVVGTALGGTLSQAGVFFSGANRFIKQPPFVRVQYRRNGADHPYILNPKPCALTNLNIDFTPTGNYTVLDNFGVSQVATVVATTIQFSLTEIKAMYSEDIANQLAANSGTNT